MSNSGVAPIDPTSLVGAWRLAYGDTQYITLVPPVTGMGDYTDYSDAEIEQFLTAGSNSINNAIGYAYLQQAGAAARQSKSVKDYDLAVDLTKRAADLRATAATYFALGALDGSNDFFDIIEPDLLFPLLHPHYDGELSPALWD